MDHRSGVRKINGGHALSKTAESSRSTEHISSSRGGRRRTAHAQEKKIRHKLADIEREKLEWLDDATAELYRELEKEGINVSCGDSERIIRSIDASEPPKILSDLLFGGFPALIARPKNHEEVGICTKACRRRGVPLVIRGAASSAFGSVLPPDNGCVLDLGGMAGIISIDSEKLEVDVLSGTRWADLSLELKKHGLALKTSPSSFFSTIGGWMSTGGQGINSLSFGHIAKHIRRLRVVLPDGSEKRITPEDSLFRLIPGADGQFCAITEMTISVRPAPKYSKTIMLQASDDARALRAISALLKRKAPITHMIFFDEIRTKEINDLTPIPGDPLHNLPAVLVRIESDDRDKLRLELPEEVGCSEEPEFMANLLWDDRYFPMRGRIRGPGMLGAEVVLPLPSVAAYLVRVREMGKMFGVEIASEAHILSRDRALVLSFFLTDQRRPLMYTIHAMLSLLMTRIGTELKGRPYAIGIWNQPFVSFIMPAKRLSEMKRINRDLDPDDLFNPGLFLSKSGRLSGPIAIFIKERLTIFALGAILAAASLAGRISRRFFRSHEEEELSSLQLSALACARCGACVSICPAYLVTGRESVTARGKLLIYRKLRNGMQIDPKELQQLFLCMKCHACEEVCQTRLPLLSAYEELEDFLEGRYGRPKNLIDGFVAEVESSQEYERLLYEGVISPDASIREVDSDAV